MLEREVLTTTALPSWPLCAPVCDLVWAGMRSEQEVFISELVYKNRELLVQRGTDLMRNDPPDKPIGAAVFSQVLEGCLLTLAYSDIAGHQLCVQSWRFTDPSLN